MHCVREEYFVYLVNETKYRVSRHFNIVVKSADWALVNKRRFNDSYKLRQISIHT